MQTQSSVRGDVHKHSLLHRAPPTLAPPAHTGDLRISGFQMGCLCAAPPRIGGCARGTTSIGRVRAAYTCVGCRVLIAEFLHGAPLQSALFRCAAFCNSEPSPWSGLRFRMFALGAACSRRLWFCLCTITRMCARVSYEPSQPSTGAGSCCKPNLLCVAMSTNTVYCIVRRPHSPHLPIPVICESQVSKWDAFAQRPHALGAAHAARPASGACAQPTHASGVGCSSPNSCTGRRCKAHFFAARRFAIANPLRGPA